MDILKLAKEINKEVGVKEGGLMSSNTPALNIERISTGSLGADIVTGGGFAKYRITGIEGMESCGKSTLTEMCIAEYQKTDPRPCVIIDTEHAFDRKYAEQLGINIDQLLIVQPDSLEEAAKFFQTLVLRQDIGLIVFDSIKAAMPQKMIDGEVSDHNIGLQAKMVGVMIGSINTYLKKNRITALVINQQRENPGGFSGPTSPAGLALKFYASIRIEMYRGSKSDDTLGPFNRGWLKTVKNKTAPPFQKCEYNMQYGIGIDTSLEVLEHGVACGVLYKKGHSTYYDKTFTNDPDKSKDHLMLGKGKRDSRDFLNDNLELRKELYNIILKAHLE